MRAALAGWACLIYFFLFSPIVLLILLSFNKNRYGTFPITGWTLHWFTSIANSPDLQSAIKTSLRVAFEVTLVSHGRGNGGSVLARAEPPALPDGRSGSASPCRS